MSVRAPLPVEPATVVALTTRERARRLLRPAFPRRRGRLLIVRRMEELRRAVVGELVDAVVLDSAVGDDLSEAASLVRELPSVPFLAIVPARPGEADRLVEAARLECVDLICDGIDDAVLAALVEPHRFTARFATALREPPPELRLTTGLQRSAWQSVVARTGRPTTTGLLAAHFHLSREHLSRSFAADGAPTLKRVIDIVRVCSAAELAKNPCYDIGDVARLLGFASSSHLAATTQRLVGVRPTSLARLRTVDLLGRFMASEQLQEGSP